MLQDWVLVDWSYNILNQGIIRILTCRTDRQDLLFILFLFILTV